MKWTFWKVTGHYIYVFPLVAIYNDEDEFDMRFGWLRWRCGFVVYKEEKK